MYAVRQKHSGQFLIVPKGNIPGVPTVGSLAQASKRVKLNDVIGLLYKWGWSMGKLGYELAGAAEAEYEIVKLSEVKPEPEYQVESVCE